MHQMGLVCALTLSVITGGFRGMDWDPDRRPAPPAFLGNHPSSALAEAAFVSGAIASGIAARTMRACSRDELICILPLGVAINSAMKRRLIWDHRLRDPRHRLPGCHHAARTMRACSRDDPHPSTGSGDKQRDGSHQHARSKPPPATAGKGPAPGGPNVGRTLCVAIAASRARPRAARAPR